MGFDTHRCIGCGLCVSVCPKKAIDIRRDGSEFSIILDDEKCTLCGLCSDFCFYDALEIITDGKRESFIDELLGGVLNRLEFVEDKCTFCSLCSENCPRNALEVERWLDYKNVRNGTLTCHLEHCSSCGVCEEVCPVDAVMMVLEGKLPFPKFDMNKCIYCGLCAGMCPEHCIDVQYGVIEKSIERISGNFVINRNRCSLCGICEDICPKDAIKVRRLLRGYIEISHGLCMDGCTICVDKCENRALVYKPDLNSKKRIDWIEDKCNLCGACRAFCPTGAIQVERHLIEDLAFENVPQELRPPFSWKDREKKIALNSELCTGCGICVEVCPITENPNGTEKTFEIIHGRNTMISEKGCSLCGKCVESCPENILWVLTG